MKRTFRSVATIAGLIERKLPGTKKSGRQATFSSDILFSDKPLNTFVIDERVFSNALNKRLSILPPQNIIIISKIN